VGTWLPAAPHVAVALLVLLLPGALVLWAAGAPLRRALAYAPAPSAGLVGLTAVGGGLLGLPFGVPLVAAATGAAAGALVLLRLALRRWRRSPAPAPVADRPARAGTPSLVAAVGLAAVLLGLRLAGALGGPDRISQTFDAVFHLNTTRYIVESGNGSSLGIAGWATGGGGFYPAVWHDIAALVAFDGDVVTATQALGLAVGAVVWPLSVLTLVHRLVGPRPVVLLGTAAVLGGLGIFPARMLDFGVLYPFLLGIAALPALVTMTVLATARPEQRGDFRGLSLWLGIGLGVVGLALAHAGVLVAFGLVVVPLALVWTARTASAWWRRGHRVLTAAALVGTAVVGLAALRVVDRSATLAQMRTTNWPPQGTGAQAVGSWLMASPHQFPVPWAFTALVLAGIAVALSTRGLRWLPAAHACLALPFVMAAGIDTDLSQRITGFWYSDSARLGALLPVTAVPLAAVALAWLATQVVRRSEPLLARSVPSPRRRVVAWAAVAATIAGLVVVTTDRANQVMYDALDDKYAVRDRAAPGTLLSAEEWRLLERLPELLPPGARVAANPWDGSGLAYAVAGVEVLVPQLGARPAGDAQVVAEGLGRAAADPQVCAALEELGIRYALDFGDPLWPDRRARAYPGLDRLFSSPAVRLVESEGDARLYEVTACGSSA
jgi:hypothetical protein